MGLKAPGILTFMVSIILTVTVLIMKLFGAQIPFLIGNEFWAPNNFMISTVTVRIIDTMNVRMPGALRPIFPLPRIVRLCR